MKLFLNIVVDCSNGSKIGITVEEFFQAMLRILRALNHKEDTYKRMLCLLDKLIILINTV